MLLLDACAQMEACLDNDRRNTGLMLCNQCSGVFRVLQVDEQLSITAISQLLWSETHPASFSVLFSPSCVRQLFRMVDNFSSLLALRTTNTRN